MSRSAINRNPAVVRMFANDGDAPSPEEMTNLIHHFIPDTIKNEVLMRLAMDRFNMRDCLKKAGKTNEALKQKFESMTAPPWYVAEFAYHVMTLQGGRAAVVREGKRYPEVLNLDEELDASTLSPGDLVYVSCESDVVVRNAEDLPRSGQEATVTRRLDDDRVEIECEGRVYVARAAPLGDVELKRGDRVIWSASTETIYEKVERSGREDLFLSEQPTETFNDVGGLDKQIREITKTLKQQIKYPDLLKRFHFKPERGILLTGVPGNGKTLLAKALSNYLKVLCGVDVSLFVNVKPGQMLSEWFGRSEANYREIFAIAGQRAQETGYPVVLFFDELDSVGVARGTRRGDVGDRVSTALYAEIDGLAERGKIFCVAATNRADTLDPALLRPGRFGKIIEVPGPTRAAAADILGKHLRADIPYDIANGTSDTEAVREEIIERAISAIYAPNGASHLATLKFRDNNMTRNVQSADLVSGAVLAQIASHAISTALERSVQEGALSGLRMEDVLVSVQEQFAVRAGILTPENCHLHLGDLPRDAQVIDVALHCRKTETPPVQYLKLRVA